MKHIKLSSMRSRVAKIIFLVTSYFLVLNFLAVPIISATTQRDIDSITSGQAYFDICDTENSGSTGSSGGATAEGDLDRFLQVLALLESGGDPNLPPNISSASGKYQFLSNYRGESLWVSNANSYYPPAAAYNDEYKTPEPMQDAAVYLQKFSLFKNNKDIKKDIRRLAIYHYVPAALTDESVMNTVPANNVNSPAKYGDIFMEKMKNGEGKNIKLYYRDAPDFMEYYNKEDGNNNTPLGSFPGTRSGSTDDQETATSSESTSRSSKATIVIDPGHIPGSKFFGVDSATGVNDMDWDGAAGERQAAFDIAKDLKKELEDDGYKVYLTKNTVNQVLSLRDRADKANSVNADLAISIHYDNAFKFGDWGLVWPQKVGLYRRKGTDGKGAKVTFNDQEVANKSKQYAEKIQEARNKYENNKVTLGQLSEQSGRITIDGHTSAGGNIPLVQLFSKVPWVYNEAGGKNLDKDKYMKGMLEGIESAVSTSNDQSFVDDQCTDTDNYGASQGDIVQTALNFSWPTPKIGEYRPDTDSSLSKAAAKPAYVEAVEKYQSWKGESIYSDCGAFVGTVMLASKADPKYQPRGTGNQEPYIQRNISNGKYKKIENKGNTSNLEPGDIFLINVNGGEGVNGHTFLYVGPEGGEYNGRQASWHTQTPNAINVHFSETRRGTYNIYRLMQ